MILTTANDNKKLSLVDKFSGKFAIDSDKLLDTLKATAFKQRGDMQISNEQMMMLLVVADQYGLNPFTKEIYAYPSDGAIIPVVGVDGWSRIINDNPKMNGLEFRWSEEIVTLKGGKECPSWCEAVIWRKDREKPIVTREYLDEVYRPPFEKVGSRGPYTVNGPWQSHTKRMLRHKAVIQCARLAFGFVGIYDEDEAGRIIEGEAQPLQPCAPKLELPPTSPEELKAKSAAIGLISINQFTQIKDLLTHLTPEEIESDKAFAWAVAPGNLEKLKFEKAQELIEKLNSHIDTSLKKLTQNEGVQNEAV